MTVLLESIDLGPGHVFLLHSLLGKFEIALTF